LKIKCPKCAVLYRVDVSKISEKGISTRCARCQIRFVLLKVLRHGGEKDSVVDLALATPEIGDSPVRIYTKDSQKLLTQLRRSVQEGEGLLSYKNSLIETKLALEESASELLKSKAKVRMLEEELRRIRKKSWWQRLLWR
jgi:predicted Zn finger-like uncharacterized protein